MVSGMFQKITESDIERRIVQRGVRGMGRNHLLWTRKQDFSKKPTAKKLRGIKVRRSHHLLYQHEYKICLPFKFSPSFTDNLEQFQLALEASTNLAEWLGIRPPLDPQTKESAMVIADFFVEVEASGTNSFHKGD
jgi:hypothetical protein